MDAIIEQSSDTRITRIVDEITNTLERGELRLRPFSNVPHDATKEQLRTFAAAEVGRSIERVRMKLPSEPSDADARQAIKALEPFANAPMIREAIYWLRMYKQERPPCADADKWRCASEAFYLMDTLSSERPTDYLDGPFFFIAAKLYETLTGDADASMQRVCKLVLAARHKFRLGSLDEP